MSPRDIIAFDATSSVVVLGAHPDDAVRACGGVMLRVMEADASSRSTPRPALSLKWRGMKQPSRSDASSAVPEAWGLKPGACRLTVIAVTNGAALFGEDGVAEGWKTAADRKAEQVRALQALGVPAERVFFLGFPDGGLAEMLRRHRIGDPQAYPCPWLDTDRVKDDGLVSTGAPFQAESLLGILQTLFADARPAHLFTHHRQDKHPDHRAVTEFACEALSRLSAPCERFAYLTYHPTIHWPPSGERVGLDAARSLRFEGEVVDFPLTDREIRVKNCALDCFVPILGEKYIGNWRRTNEVFWRTPPCLEP